MENSALLKLKPRQQLFVREYLGCLNASEACRRSGYHVDGHHHLMSHPGIKAAIEEGLAAGVTEASMEAAELIREMARIVRADPNEIVEYRRVNCRHCWGGGYHYQYTTQAKLDQAVHQHEEDQRRKKKAFDESPEALCGDYVATEFVHGGIGFDATREPNPDCPECSGEGHGEVFVKDTRLLSPAARALFAGVKISKDGVEIKMHSKDKQMEMMARILGLLKDSLKLDVADDIVERLLAGRKRAGGV